MGDLARRIAMLSAEKRALLEQRLGNRKVESGAGEPLAIIGIGCRFPGGAVSPESFWSLLAGGVDAITEVPTDRWDADACYDPDWSKPGKASTRWGGFLEGIDEFDAGFFGISPREARRMDPQQRLLLEVAWEAFEDGGQSAERLAGSRTGVYVGVPNQSSDYYRLQFADPSTIDLYTGTGTAHSIVANRLSYLLDLRGPSLAVDTACSSSLVAVHLACCSLRARECDLAIAGGINLMLTPEMAVTLSKLQMMALDGRCKTFDARADGFVRGEGCGLVLLKRLADAQADGDDIVALIRGSAVNQDGRTNGLTAPSGLSQQQVLQAAHHDAGVAPGQITYIEAHGTGTALGDPIEVEALAAVFSGVVPSSTPCLLGSVKTNFGHLEAAAGIAGLVKTALSIRHRRIPPHLHFRGLNPHISLEGTPFEIATEGRDWQADSLLAGVSSFGFGGTNAHVVVGDPPASTPKDAVRKREAMASLLPISARHPNALRQLAASYRDLLRNGGDERMPTLLDFCWAAATRRTHHDHRLAVVGATREEMVARLDRFLAGEVDAAVATAVPLAEGQAPRLAFVFSGQGPQWLGMGRELVEHEVAFRDVIDRCDGWLERRAGWSVRDELFADENGSRLSRTDVAQPVNFALQAGLVELYRSWGITPDAVVGHSAGEAAAAWAAGALGLEDALAVIHERACLMQQAAGGGKMASLELSGDEVEAEIRGRGPALSIAAINGPRATVITGEAAAVDELLGALKSRQVRCRELPMSFAFHSSQMEPFRARLVERLSSLKPASGSVPFVSTVTGDHRDGAQLDCAYWGRNLREPVRFTDAVERLAADGFACFLEIGAHPVLSGSISALLRDRQPSVTTLASLRRGQPERAALLASLGALYARGAAVEWQGVLPGTATPVKLPTYPWQRQRYWIDAATPTATYPPRSLLGTPAATTNGARRIDTPLPTFEFSLDAGHPWSVDRHRLGDADVLPLTAYFELVSTAAGEVLGTEEIELQGLVIREPVALHDEGGARLQLTLIPEDESGGSFRLYGRSTSSAPVAGDDWVLHASGKVSRVVGDRQRARRLSLDEVRERCRERVDDEQFRRAIAPYGHEDRERSWRSAGIWRGTGEALRGLVIDDQHANDNGLAAAQALLGCFELVPLTLPDLGDGIVHVPASVAGLRRLASPGHRCFAHARVRDGRGAVSGAAPILDLAVLGEDGQLLVDIEGVEVRPAATARAAERGLARSGWYHDLTWQPAPPVGGAARITGAEATEALRDRAARVFEAAGAEIPAHQEFFDRLDALASGYAVRALRRLGCALRVNDRIDVAELVSHAGVAAHRRPLLRHLLDCLEQDGFLADVEAADAETAEGASWRVVCAPDELDVDEQCEVLARQAPEFVGELGLVRRCGEQLDRVLQGSRDPLELLFSEEGENDLDAVYGGSPLIGLYNRAMRAALEAAVASAPASSAWRVLEIGAGTGSTTAHLLPALPPERTEYVFTDVSPGFIARAERKFAEHPFVSYRTLDIEADGGNGEPPHETFDVIVAANVLHATSDLHRTLRNVRRLLAPGGLLLLLEVTERQRWIDVTFGLTDGWWRFTDRDVRSSHPLLSTRQWRSLLADNGFGDAVAVPTGTAARHGLLIARNNESGDTPPVSWLLFADGDGIGRALAERIKRRGETVTRVVREGPPAELGDGSIRVDPRDIGRIGDIVRDAGAGSPAGDQRIVHLWSLDADPAVNDVELPWEGLAAGLLHVAQACAGTSAMRRRLWFVTRGAQAATSHDPAPVPEQAITWGFGRCIALEAAEIWGGLIDLDASSSPEEHADRLLDELLAQADEDQVALRGAERYVPRIVQAPLSSEGEPTALHKDASYLITGGLGGLGVELARWFASLGAGHLVLVGRQEMPPRAMWSDLPPNSEAARKVAAIRAVEALGCRVSTPAVDVADGATMSALMQRFGKNEPPLRGVAHCAADVQPSPLHETGLGDVLRVLAPKVEGSRILHELSLSHDLDFFILFSSTTSLLGSAGFAAYGAGNQYLDALAYARRHAGLPALSVNWGTWDVMRGFSDELQDSVARTGLRRMPVEPALACLGDLLASATPHKMVADVDWTVLKPLYEAKRHRPLLELLDGTRREATGSAAPLQRHVGIGERIRTAASDDRRPLLLQHLGARVAGVLGLDPGAPLDADQGLFALGMDSLTSTDLKRQLEADFGTSLPATLVFNYPNIGALARYLEDKVVGAQPDRSASRLPEGQASDGATATVAIAADDTELDGLSEAELSDLLATELRRLRQG
jgi:acyl transferase domain-containing protein/SAM-dependent methyltransferase/NAD(P)-dependent dehydrogenase (short-subunit alcohol dehydrogenase family)/acyl carrier protein